MAEMPEVTITISLASEVYFAALNAAEGRQRSLEEHINAVLRQTADTPPHRRGISLTPTQDKLHRFIAAYQDQHRSTVPSFAEMAEHMGFKSKSSVVRLIQSLEDRGVLRQMRRRARAMELLVRPT